MAGLSVFECVCTELERCTSLSALEARGTVRLLLKDAGLDASTVTVRQMEVVLNKLLPASLRSRGVANSEAVAKSLIEVLRASLSATSAGTRDATYDVFARLGGADLRKKS